MNIMVKKEHKDITYILTDTSNLKQTKWWSKELLRKHIKDNNIKIDFISHWNLNLWGNTVPF